MRSRYLMVAAGLIWGCAAPAGAGEKDAYAELDVQLERLVSPQTWLKGTLTEADVSLLFDYIKASMFAASQGLPAPAVPAEVRQRLDKLKQDLTLRGTLSGLLLLNALEAAARQAVREAITDPDAPR